MFYFVKCFYFVKGDIFMQTKMKHAVIMAGGEGQRLRPITESIPKPLVPVAGEPAMTHIIRLLARHGFTSAAVTLRYKGDAIEKYYGSEAYGLKLTYFYETEPLGTAGSVRNAVGGAEEDILVISGDAVCSADLSAAVDFHTSRGAEATLILAHAASPSEFGVVVCGEDGQIRGFIEKPSEAEARADTVNTGIYILSADMVRRIPEGVPYDFGRDLFARVLSEGARLFGYVSDAYWCDIGTLDALYHCNFDAADGKIDGISMKVRREFSHITHAIVGRGCFLPATCRVNRSILFDGVRVGSGSVVDGSILCANVKIGRNAVIEKGCVIGEGAVIGDGLHLEARTRVAPMTVAVTVPSADGDRDVVFDGCQSIRSYFHDDGLYLGKAAVPDGQLCVRVGTAAAAYLKKRGGTAAVMYDGSTPASLAAHMTAESIGASGIRCFAFGTGTYDEAAFAAVRYGTALTLFITEEGGRLTLYFLDENGLYPSRSFERSFESGLCSGHAVSVTSDAVFPTAVTGTRLLLAAALQEEIGSSLRGFEFSADNSASAMLLRRILEEAGAVYRQNSPRRFCFTGTDGLFLRENGDSADRYMLTSLLIRRRAPRRAAVPDDAPAYLEKLAEQAGTELKRYTHCPASEDGEIRETRRLAGQQLWISNRLFLAVASAVCLHESRASLAELLHELPVQYRSAADIQAPHEKKTWLLQRLSDEAGAQGENAVKEGICIRCGSGGFVRIIPRKSAAVRIVTESSTMEAAEELMEGQKVRLIKLLKGEN